MKGKNKNKWMSNTFWKVWVEKDELERIEFVKELTGIYEINATLKNSYFEDLEEYLKSSSEDSK